MILLLCIKRRQNLGLSQSQNRFANLRKHNIHIPHGRFTQKKEAKKATGWVVLLIVIVLVGLCFVLKYLVN